MADKDYDEMTPEELDAEEEKLGQEEQETEVETDSEDSSEKEELEKEIESDDSEKTQESETETVDETDKRFKDKTKEDVEKSYRELEQLYKRQGNELGDLRKVASKIEELEKRLEVSKPPEEGDEVPVFDGEEYSQLLVENPTEAAKYLWERHTLPQLQEYEKLKEDKLNEQQTQQREKENIQKQNDSFKEFFDMDEFKDMDEVEGNKFGVFLRENVRLPKQGYFSKDDLIRAYSWFNPERQILEVKKKTIQQMEDAAPEVATLTGGKDAKGKAPKVPEGDMFDVADWAEDNLSPEEIEKRIKEMD